MTETEMQGDGFITAAPSSFETSLLNLDSSIHVTLSGIKQMENSVKNLQSMELHPTYAQVVREIDGLIQEALIPYLDQVDQEFRKIADI